MVALRLAVALGDPEREQRLLPGLGASDEVRVAERCLSADQLLDAVSDGRVDVALVAADLHRLGSGALADLTASRLPMVLLVADPREARWQAQPGVILALDAGAELVERGIVAAIHGERLPGFEAAPPPQPIAEPLFEPQVEAGTGTGPPSVIAIGSGAGSPGRSTTAVNLATALGAVQPSIVVDVDLAAPSVAAMLDADPTRNVYMVAHAEPDSPWEWDRAIESEVQPIDRHRSPYGAVLCGVPKPDMRGRITARFVEGLLHALQRRYRYVVLDTGAEWLGSEGAVHRAALGLSQQVLLVCSADLVGMVRARTGLSMLESHLHISPSRVALVVNRHDPRFHHGRTEIEWALKASTACLVPYDHLNIERALATQRPAVLQRRGAAGRALLDLAERLHGGRLVLPPEPQAASRRASWRLPAVPGLKRAEPQSASREPAA
jgi:MinD-like ATPase involved in chromosome partitioning or flagellar assembly